MTNFDTFQIFVLYAQTTEISKIPGYKPLKTTIMEVFLEIYMYSIEKIFITFRKSKCKYDH